ncbi:hypothetical protein PHLGIDRAFT_355635 [Phlebiopsis gigantea 11061_1 CR5-6]|uniref:Peptidase S8/S53 domain-containing protein n=1 Tax=Phlebiopsis gigantea (strain 11061_1 CR5-6) TaxID=745531 RepID=A0A0C3NUH7_PHLG1|nr:hypothetical protein PHLGIDRAFT_355635 [Phlebiopsis gigantea 11061_1 CR5-6]
MLTQPQCVDVTAPSYYLPHADIGSREDYAYKAGTSQSAPLVTGVIAALVTAGQPGHDMSPHQLRDLLLKDRVHGGYTYGGIMELPANTPDRIISAPILSTVPQ